MAFDLYAGSVSRFYADEWENVVQAQAKKTGTSYTKIRPNPKIPLPKRSEVREAVTRWQKEVSEHLKEHIKEKFSWDESDDSPYFTDRPGWQGYGALLLSCVYAEQGLKVPETVPEDWLGDPVFTSSIGPDSNSKYRPVTEGAFWIPCDFDFGFIGPNILADQVFISSSKLLLETLNKLNEIHFHASPADLAKFRKEEIQAATQLDADAKFTFALFHDLATKSIQHKVPILLSF